MLITSKIPATTGVPNPQNPPSSNATMLGSGFVYDNHGHIVTNGHVVGDSQIVDVTFLNGNRYTAMEYKRDYFRRGAKKNPKELRISSICGTGRDTVFISAASGAVGSIAWYIWGG